MVIDSLNVLLAAMREHLTSVPTLPKVSQSKQSLVQVGMHWVFELNAEITNLLAPLCHGKRAKCLQCAAYEATFFYAQYFQAKLDTVLP